MTTARGYIFSFDGARRHLRHGPADKGRIQIGRREHDAGRVPRQRDELWAQIAPRGAPHFTQWQARTGRTLPIAVLTAPRRTELTTPLAVDGLVLDLQPQLFLDQLGELAVFGRVVTINAAQGLLIVRVEKDCPPKVAACGRTVTKRSRTRRFRNLSTLGWLNFPSCLSPNHSWLLIMRAGPRLTFRFSGALSPREHLPGNAPTAQLTRIDAANRLFSVPLNTHNKYTEVCRFVRGIPVGIGLIRAASSWRSAGPGRHVLGFLGLAYFPSRSQEPGEVAVGLCELGIEANRLPIFGLCLG